ncbi:MAG: hypothetical protein JO340_09165 [Acidobacteriaceae bacterium]|nr:hypothetical protein [Acidobacteriaceae bacterium]
MTDKTWGHATYGCAVCCGYRAVYFSPDPAGVPIEDNTGVNVMGMDACSSGTANVSGYATSWTSGNTSILTAQARQIHGVAAGSTGHYAELSNIMYGPARDGYPCPLEDVETGGTGNSVALTCSPLTVDWGNSVACSVAGASASQVTQWTFSTDGVSVNGPAGSLTWSGPMVAGGTITAMAVGASPSQTITVNPRSTFPIVVLPAPSLVANGSTINGVTLPTLTSPPTTEDGSFGASTYAYNYNFTSGAANSGPNAGIYYVTSFTDSSKYAWELNPGVTNPSDPFYQHQGNCFATISQITAAVQAHEVGVPGPSHYSEVQTALSSNNPASVANNSVGSTSSLSTDFSSTYQTVASAGAPEPPSNLPSNINYPPYQTCPQ